MVTVPAWAFWFLIVVSGLNCVVSLLHAMRSERIMDAQQKRIEELTDLREFWKEEK